ncbi:MAG: molybdopterin cofactor-binding domain-containing protein [Bryobacteraceae bacterium]
MIRREFLKSGGALVVGFSLRDTLAAQERGAKAGPPDARQVDTWLAIHADNTATVYIGFAELGQGASTALLQIAAEELDLDMSQIKTVRLDTNVTPNQGGTYSSASINRGGPQVRTAAAEARLALLKLASAKLNAPQDQLTVSKGVVSGSGRSVTYGELVGDKPFNVTFTGKAPVKATTEYKIVGTKVPRNDTPAKVTAQYTYMQYVRVPEMLHGRVVRPRGQRMYGAGAKVMSVDETSLRAIPGARVVRKGDFLGVVAENEWDAIRAAQQLKVVWETPPALPGNAALFEHMLSSKTDEDIVLIRGNVTAGFSGAAHTVSQMCLGP